MGPLIDEKDAAARIGSVFAGKYRLRRVLGVGGMGAVYEAVHSFTGRPCAVKILDPSMSGIHGYAARFLREARAASEIGHPGICDVYDAGLDASDGSLYLVLELLEGESLGAAMKRGDLTTQEIVEIGVQVLDGLAAAHARGIIHRDVKPENVYVTRDEQGDLRVRLLDFGVAKNVREGPDLGSTQQGQVVGTPYYMSPEQAAGDEVDGRADIWSVGAMLFHALSGAPPFEGANYNKLILRILSEKPPSLRLFRPDLPEWLLRMVDGALLVDRTERWQSAGQMAAGLRAREVPIGLEWEGYEDATVRTDSPFATGRYSVPPVELSALTPPGGDGGRAVTPPAVTPRSAGEESPTVAASPHAHYEERKKETPRAWDRDAPRPRGRSGFVVGMLVGAAVALVAAAGVTWWLLGGPGESPGPAGRPPLLAPDAGPDAAGLARPQRPGAPTDEPGVP